MRRHHAQATTIALVVAAALIPTFSSSAQAGTPTTTTTAVTSSKGFQVAQEALEHQIIARQVQLVLLGTDVADATNVTASDRSALVTIITNEQSSLATDATNAEAATTYAQLDAVRDAVIGDERVYAVVTAQVDLVIAADNDTVAETGYSGLASELASFVSELNSQRATALLSDLSSEVTAATSLTTGVSGDALALTPAGYPGNKSQIKTYTYQLDQVARDLGTAKWDVKQIEEYALSVRSLHRGAPTTTTTMPTTTSTPPSTTSTTS